MVAGGHCCVFGHAARVRRRDGPVAERDTTYQGVDARLPPRVLAVDRMPDAAITTREAVARINGQAIHPLDDTPPIEAAAVPKLGRPKPSAALAPPGRIHRRGCYDGTD
jgi:hypothetical protein